MLLTVIRRLYGSGKIGFFLGVNWRKVAEDIDYTITRFIRIFQSFSFNGYRYRYRMDRYNRTFDNERTVEIPIFLRELRRFEGRMVLEVGNVLNHYIEHNHTVVDKYEKGKRVINKDVVDYSDLPFDLIVSISTLEHVGFDEEDKKPEKVVKAVKHLKSLLRPGGELWVSVPLGYNPEIDRMMLAENRPFDQVGLLRRINKSNIWKEITREEAQGSTYNQPFPHGNTIAIGFWHNMLKHKRNS